MRIICVSDTHTKHNQIPHMPRGNALVFAGDLSSVGCLKSIIDFNTWLGKQDYKYKIVVAGNHDIAFQKDYYLAKSLLTNAIYLQDEDVILDGIKFYGSPWQPWFYDWAFNLPRGQQLKEKWNKIPEDTNVLITHSPPFGILDQCKDKTKVGCHDLRNRIKELKDLKLHVFGHIHNSYDICIQNQVTYVNACACNEEYQITNHPIVVDI